MSTLPVTGSQRTAPADRGSGAPDFIGRGWAWPAHVDRRGAVALAAGTDELDGALRLILTTAPGERVMRPEFGCAIWDLLFAPLDANTLGLLEHAVREAVARWEPRVVLEQVTATPETDLGLVRLDVAYRIRATNDRRNLVHPFYVIPHEEPRP